MKALAVFREVLKGLTLELKCVFCNLELSNLDLVRLGGVF